MKNYTQLMKCLTEKLITYFSFQITNYKFKKDFCAPNFTSQSEFSCFDKFAFEVYFEIKVVSRMALQTL